MFKKREKPIHFGASTWYPPFIWRHLTALPINSYYPLHFNRVGVKAAKAAGMKVVAVPSLQNAADQYSNADSVLHSLLELQPELWGLPAFDDCIDLSNLSTFLILTLDCLV